MCSHIACLVWSRMILRQRRRITRALIAILLGTACISAVQIARKALRAKRTERLAVSIKNCRGNVYYDWETDADGNVMNEGLLIRWSRTPPGPRFLREVFGENLFARLTSVDFDMSRANSMGLTHLGELPDLKHLTFWSGRFGEADARRIAPLYNLETLRFFEIEMSNDTLREIGCLGNLRILMLSGRAVSDDGLVHLGTLRRLEVLHLSGTQVTGKEIGSLHELSRLKTLRLDSSAVDDRWLCNFAELVALRSLSLQYTHVTDAGIPALKRLKFLEELNLCYSFVTPRGISGLEEALPRCHIYANDRRPGAIGEE